MIKVVNNKTGQPEEIEDGGLSDLINGGEYSLLKGQELEFEDQDGQRRIVPSDEVYDALDAGFKHIPKKQVEREALVEEASNEPFKAAGAGLLRGVTMGLSDQILAASGATTPEKLSALKEGNPIVSGAADIVGNIAPLFATGGASLGAKVLAMTPAALAERAGVAAAAKIAPLTGKVLSKTASKITQEVVDNAVKYGAGSAVEGSLFGLGNLVSEDALGDAEFNAENALAAMGSNALLGGAFGAGSGAGVAMVGAGARAVKGKYNEVRKKMFDSITDPDIKKDIASKIANENAVEDYLKATGKTSDEIAEKMELEKAAERTGVPLTPGMKEGGLYAGLEGSLVKEPSIGGVLTRKEVEKTFNALDEVKNVILKDAADVDPVTIGVNAKNGIKAKISEELEPASLLYKDLAEQTKDIPLTESLKKRFKTIRQDDAYSRIYEQGQKFIDNVDNLQTYGDVSNYRTFIRNEIKKAQRGGDSNAIEFFSGLYDNLTTLRTNAIKHNLKGKPFVAKEGQIADLLGAQQMADKMWAEAHGKYEFLGDFLGIKTKNMSNLMDVVDDIDDRKLAEKVLNFKNLDGLKKFQTYFPEVSEMARAKRLNDLKKKAEVSGVFSPKKFSTLLDKLDSTDLAILAPHLKDPRQLIKDYKTIANNLPPNIGPSGTAQALSFQSMFEIPYQAKEALRYAVYKSGPDSMIANLTKYIPMSGAIEKASNKGKKEISDAVEAFFKKGGDIGIKSINRIITGQDMTKDDVKSVEDKLEMYQGSPDEIVNNFMRNNRDMLKAAPKTAEALQSRVLAAAQFLSSKVPKKEVTPFDDGHISRSEMLKFKNYVDAVENPYKVLQTIKQGYVAPEYMEAFRVVYPKMANAVKEEFIARMPEFKNISEKQKAELSKILGIESRKAFTPQGFATLQRISAVGVQQNLQEMKPNPSVKGMELSNRSQTGIEKTINR